MVKIHPSSVLAGKKVPAIMYDELVSERDASMGVSTSVGVMGGCHLPCSTSSKLELLCVYCRAPPGLTSRPSPRQCTPEAYRRSIRIGCWTFRGSSRLVGRAGDLFENLSNQTSNSFHLFHLASALWLGIYEFFTSLALGYGYICICIST